MRAGPPDPIWVLLTDRRESGRDPFVYHEKVYCITSVAAAAALPRRWVQRDLPKSVEKDILDRLVPSWWFASKVPEWADWFASERCIRAPKKWPDFAVLAFGRHVVAPYCFAAMFPRTDAASLFGLEAMASLTALSYGLLLEEIAEVRNMTPSLLRAEVTATIHQLIEWDPYVAWAAAPQVKLLPGIKRYDPFDVTMLSRLRHLSIWPVLRSGRLPREELPSPLPEVMLIGTPLEHA